MLIIAIPKSASTALMETLAKAHSLPCNMHYRWDGPASDEFPNFHMQHSFGWELTEPAADELVRPGILHKSHILPSRNNLAMLRDQKKVVLLRRADGIIGAYKRGQETGVYRQKTRIFDDCRTLAQWRTRAREAGLYQDLESFRAKWLGAGGDQLVVHYQKLISDPAREIARIEAYFGWPASGTKELLKRKYTRLGDQSLSYHQATFETWKEVAQ